MSLSVVSVMRSCHCVSTRSENSMGRWAPDAEGRFRAAALDLFVERGYEQTTVADIAERAGLTRRTFFRYFADKREVLFSGSEVLAGRLTDALEFAAAGTSPLDCVAGALGTVAEL